MAQATNPSPQGAQPNIAPAQGTCAQPVQLGAAQARVLNFIMQAGKAMLENGAEVFRVEQTMLHMAKGYALPAFHVYIIANGIFASCGGQLSELRNVPSRTVHLGRVAAINAISRQIAAGNLPIAQAEQALADALQMPDIHPKTRVLASAFGAFSFCFLFGGTLPDALLSLCAGGALGGYLAWCETRKVGGLFTRLSGAALAAAFCVLFTLLLRTFGVVSLHSSASIIGAFMILTPGVAFTMAIRDFVRADYLSGTIRMIDAVLIAASIALGAGLMLWVEQLLLGGA